MNYFRQFHPIVWGLLAGTVLARGASFMTLPFLAIYLSNTIGLHPVIIGITIGISPLTSTVGGFVGGHFSDRFGRKKVMLGALFTWSAVFYGFAFANTPLYFILLNALNGLCRSFFEPTSQALIADLTEKERRMKAFSLRYTAVNLGASIGPLLGAFFAVKSADITFIFTGSVYLLYGLSLLMLFNKYLGKGNKNDSSAKKVLIKDAFKVIRKDKALLYLILGSIFINAGYAQIDSNLPQFLKDHVINGVYLYSILLSLNAIMVVLLQMPISHIVERFRPMQVMMSGAFLMALGLLGFGVLHGWSGMIISMALLTVGEILIFPSSSLVIDQLASGNLRGTYFGASQFRSLGQFIGPIAGGFIIEKAGGEIMFMMMSAVALSSMIFFLMGNREQAKATATIKKANT